MAVTHNRIFSRGLYTNFCFWPTPEQLWTLRTDPHEQYSIMIAPSALLKCWKWCYSSRVTPQQASLKIAAGVRWHRNVATQLLWNHFTSEFNSVCSFMQKNLGVLGTGIPKSIPEAPCQSMSKVTNNPHQHSSRPKYPFPVPLQRTVWLCPNNSLQAEQVNETLNNHSRLCRVTAIVSLLSDNNKFQKSFAICPNWINKEAKVVEYTQPGPAAQRQTAFGSLFSVQTQRNVRIAWPD